MDKEKSKYHQSKSQLETEQLAVEAAVKNPQRFDVLYNKYFLSIYKYVLLRVEGKHLTDDIVSRVFAKALYKIKQYKFKGYPFSSWLFRIAYNEMNDTFRKRKVTRIVQVPVESLQDIVDNDNYEDQLDRDRQLKMLLEGIRKLNQDDIDLIELRFFEKRAFREVGEILNITEDNAKVKTHRVVKKLKKILQVI